MYLYIIGFLLTLCLLIGSAPPRGKYYVTSRGYGVYCNSYKLHDGVIEFDSTNGEHYVIGGGYVITEER
ncbi:MAG: hypothetical protein JSS82_15635 [Bacteroidetes bacterium]|nr:hypothetical protein [Bacteroidota bacterium]